MSIATHTRTYTSEADSTEHGVTADLALGSGEHVEIGETPFTVLVPRSAELRVIDPEALGLTPARPRGTVRPTTVKGLVAYCREHDDGKTEAWITTERIVAVLNAQDENEGVGWGDHRAVLDLAKSPQWLHWLKYDGQMLSQEDLAEHVEDGQLDIVTPAAAEMLEVVQDLQVSRSASFRSSKSLHAGTIGFTYDETDTATAGTGKSLEIPTEFELGVPVFLGEAAYRVKVRFRYRLNEGALTLGYKIERPDLIEQEAAAQIAERLRGLAAPTTDENAKGETAPEPESNPFVAIYEGDPADPVKAGRLD